MRCDAHLDVSIGELDSSPYGANNLHSHIVCDSAGKPTAAAEHQSDSSARLFVQARSQTAQPTGSGEGAINNYYKTSRSKSAPERHEQMRVTAEAWLAHRPRHACVTDVSRYSNAVGDAALGVEFGFCAQPVFHIMAWCKSVILKVEIGPAGDFFG